MSGVPSNNVTSGRLSPAYNTRCCDQQDVVAATDDLWRYRPSNSSSGGNHTLPYQLGCIGMALVIPASPADLPIAFTHLYNHVGRKFPMAWRCILCRLSERRRTWACCRCSTRQRGPWTEASMKVACFCAVELAWQSGLLFSHGQEKGNCRGDTKTLLIYKSPSDELALRPTGSPGPGLTGKALIKS